MDCAVTRWHRRPAGSVRGCCDIGHRPPQLHPPGYDEVIAVPEADRSRRPAGPRAEGIFSGSSTSADLAAALRLAHGLQRGHCVVTIHVGSG